MVHKHTVPIRIINRIIFLMPILLVLTILYFILDFEIVQTLIKLAFLYYTGNLIYFVSTAWFRYKNFRYQLSDDNLHIHRGFLLKSEDITPLKRMQHIEIEQSFGSRLFNKYEINIYTAGGGSFIGYLELEKAKEIRKKLIAFIEGDNLDIDVAPNPDTVVKQDDIHPYRDQNASTKQAAGDPIE